MWLKCVVEIIHTSKKIHEKKFFLGKTEFSKEIVILNLA